MFFGGGKNVQQRGEILPCAHTRRQRELFCPWTSQVWKLKLRLNFKRNLKLSKRQLRRNLKQELKLT